jgi:acetoacetyl-CoA reductase/3-oxoacyl-[acyl-carrier protein] reductase
VIGASGGIGSATVQVLERKGYTVYGTYCINATYGQYQLNVRDIEPINKFIATVQPLDILVICTGKLQQKPYTEISYDNWQTILDANLVGAFNCIRAALPGMIERQRGSIVTVASVGGQQGGTLAVHYAAAKAGVISLTKSFARIGAPSVRVNCVSPGLVDTAMTRDELTSEAGREKVARIPMQRPAYPCEIAEVIVSVAESTYMTGAVVNVNGGQYI